MPEETSSDSFCPIPPGTSLPTVGPDKAIDPRAHGTAFDRLCTNGLRYHFIAGMIRDALVFHFSDVDNLEPYDLRGYVWKPGKTTGILVESNYRWTPKLAGKRPAILVKRNSVQNRPQTVGNRDGTTQAGAELFRTSWYGSHTVFCLHDTGPGTEILGAEVAQFLSENGPLFIRKFHMLNWQVIDIAPVGILEEDKQGFVVPVTVGWAYDHGWMLELESRRLRAVKLTRLLDIE